MRETARSTAKKALRYAAIAARVIVRAGIPITGLVLIWKGASAIYAPAGPLAVGMLLWLDSTVSAIRRRPG